MLLTNLSGAIVRGSATPLGDRKGTPLRSRVKASGQCLVPAQTPGGTRWGSFILLGGRSSGVPPHLWGNAPGFLYISGGAIVTDSPTLST